MSNIININSVAANKLTFNGQNIDVLIVDNVEVWKGLSAPTITTQPTNNSIYQGDTAVLTVVATDEQNGSGITYQWYKGTTLISGATSSSYSITDINVGSSQYKVIVQNSSGSTESNTVTVTVLQDDFFEAL